MIHPDLSHYSQLPVQSKDSLYILNYIDLYRDEGPLVLITAGMDGDEYDGIDAAVKLGQIFQNDTNWNGRRVIFPLVNRSGFLAGISKNPIDNKYPKHIFPGDVSGTISDQLIHAIFDYVNKPIDIWIDLHGGATHETLFPFIWTFTGSSNNARKKIYRCLSHISTSTIVNSSWNKATKVGIQDIAYFVLESGGNGEHNQDSVKRLVEWTISLLHQELPQKVHPHIYTSVQYITASSNGYWFPSQIEPIVKKSMKVGTFVPYGATQMLLTSPCTGTCLWFHSGGWVVQGEILFAIAR